MFSLIQRNYAAFFPSKPAKTSDALRIGLLGASKIAPMSIIIPVQNHPGVIVAAVAARDRDRATEYAKAHGIPIVHESYQDLIDDSAIDAVYIPLPNGLHYEWALKSLKAGKHVLLEKPSVSNATEAAYLFRHELLQRPNAPILLEAFHSRFHPAWQTFLSLLNQPNIISAHAQFHFPHFPNFLGVMRTDDIRFQYDLAGGAMMDLGTYMVLAVRQMLGMEPEDCLEASARLMPEGYDQKCDHSMKAKWKFPNGAIGEIEAEFGARGGYPLPWLTSRWPSGTIPRCSATHREVTIKDDSLADGLEHVSAKTVTFNNFMGPSYWHRIDIAEIHTVRTAASQMVIKTWTETCFVKAYGWENIDSTQPGDQSWTTYRNMLEQFVNRIRGQKGSGVWMGGEDSICNIAMIDSAYEKAGLPLRPTSTYK